nr:unnamed protein product [Callosobruchus analis]CAI5826910.1 unnamed protein product [Callosobruchus analis]
MTAFQNSDTKTLYFTGILMFTALKKIFSLIEPYMTVTYKSAVKDPFKQFMITMVKLRLNVPFRFIAHHFSVSEQTVYRIFFKVINIMYYRLKNFVIWPDRENLRLSMPTAFRDRFGDKVCVIIDCFEVFTEKSSNLEAKAATWSTYKHHNTVKILIGITPQGTISFVSDPYGGRISDKKLTEGCGILENLLPGDVILADRGFLIGEIVGLHMAKVVTPAFLKGKKQMDPQNIEETRKVASVR